MHKKVTITMRNKDYESFRKFCKHQDLTLSYLLRKVARDYIRENDGKAI